MIQDAWDWCTGMTQRDGMGREVGEGKGGMIWENGIENMYNIIYETNRQSRFYA